MLTRAHYHKARQFLNFMFTGMGSASSMVVKRVFCLRTFCIFMKRSFDGICIDTFKDNGLEISSKWLIHSLLSDPEYFLVHRNWILYI